MMPPYRPYAGNRLFPVTDRLSDGGISLPSAVSISAVSSSDSSRHVGWRGASESPKVRDGCSGGRQQDLSDVDHSLPFVDLKAPYARLRPDVRIRKVLKHGHYVLGPRGR